MANGEIGEALDHVREAESAVSAALTESGLTPHQREILDHLAETLRDLDARLVLAELKSEATAFGAKARQLIALNQETQEKLQGLQKVAESVEKVAKAVNGLVKAFGVVV